MRVYDPKIYRPTTQQQKIGIYVSKKNKPVQSRNDADFAFVPDKPSISIKRRLSLSVDTNYGVGVAEFKHGFGYTPQVIAFVTTYDAVLHGANVYDPGNTYINVPSTWITGDEVLVGTHFEVFDCWADDQNVYVQAQRYTEHEFGTDFYTWVYTFDILLLMEEAN
jgi:hypothetical protein